MNKFDVIVLGGGPAGMIAAGTAAELGRKTLLIEKNDKLGKKLFITGKGRCNLTNAAEKEEFFDNLTRNPKFFLGSFSRFSNKDLITFFEDMGMRTKVERGNRVFPESDRSSDVIKALTKYLDRNNVTVKLGQKVKSIISEKNIIKGVLLENGQEIFCDSLVICTGGLSYPDTGSTGDGYIFGKKLGHKIIEPTPSLVPLLTAGTIAQELQGLSLKNVNVSVMIDGKKVFEDFGEMLFSHFGLTGPIILSASFYVVPSLKKNKKIQISIDLKPALDETALDKRLLRDFEKNTNKQFKNALDELFPGKLVPIMIKLSGINPEKQVNIITKEERKGLVKLIKSFDFIITGTRPVSEAIITSGGIDVKEINPKTMESKLIKGLYFAGEVMDLDAYTGGFNLQIAFSTGRMAGMNV